MKTARATKTRGGKTKVSFSIACPSQKLDGLPFSFQPSFAIEVGRFGPAEVKKALADFEMITSLLRKSPKEMSEIVNHVMAGRTAAANEIALRIGLTEEAFQSKGGGMLWAIMIGFAFGGIFYCASFGC